MKKLGTIIDKLKQGEGAPTRHHNPYFQEALNLNGHLFTETELTQKKGALFEKNQPLVIEIGCYMGKNVQEFAKQNPQLNFMGLDITYKRAVKAAKKLQQDKLSNAKIALCQGELFLGNYIENQSVQGVCVFFPDPWPKERHEKNRLLKKEFLSLLKEKLTPDGFFWLKTDAKSYFDQTNEFLLELGFHLKDPQEIQPKILQGGPYETAFQKIFVSKNVPFYQGVYSIN